MESYAEKRFGNSRSTIGRNDSFGSDDDNGHIG